MGLFDKKYCDVCGEKIGLLGNRKLEDGNLCKDCAKKLSPWCDDRRHSTVDEIKAQLDYREQNKEVLKSFNPTKEFGQYGYHLYIDEQKGQFVAARKFNREENPDVINLSQVTSCYMDIDERQQEEFRTNKDGDRVSYNPPRYKYSYDYYVYICVDSPYFDELKLEMNNISLSGHDNNRRHEIERMSNQIVGYISQAAGMPNQMGMQGGMGMPNQMGMNQGGMGMPNQMGMNQGGMGMPNQMGMNQGGMGMPNQMGMNQGGMGMPNQMDANQGMGVQQDGGQWTCPSCGTVNSSKFCESCGTPKQ